MGLTRKQWLTLIVIIVGTFITVLNQTLVTPALPSIMAETGVDAATGQWLTTGFTLVNAIMIPITAYLQDRFSVKSLFVFSMGLFCIGSALAGWGHVFAVLVAGRVIQAAGTGILMPMSMTVLLTMFPIDKRGSAMGIFGLVIAFAPAIGPTVGGIVIDQADWHFMFWGIAGLSLISLVLGCIFIGNRQPDKKGNSALDVLSVVLSTVGFGGLLYGFSIFGSYGIDPLSIAAMIVGAACVVGFFIRQTHLKIPMLRVRVLYNRKFLVATIIGMLIQASLLAAGILMPIYIQSLMGYSATLSGLVLMPGAIIMGIMNPIAGKLFDKHGPRTLGLIGMTLLLLTTIAFSFLNLHTNLIFIALVFTVRMFSMSLINMPITTWGMNALDTKLINHGTSVNNTLRQVAGSLGTAIVISISTVMQNSAYGWFGLNANTASGYADAMMFGINMSFLASAVMILIGLILTFIFVKGRPGTTDAIGHEAREGTKAETDVDAEENKKLLQRIMKADVYTLPTNATVKDAMSLFIEKKISACPIVDETGHAVGFISDGDILKNLAHQRGAYLDPVALIAASARDETDYDEKLAYIMDLPVSAVGVKATIGVNIYSDLEEVCRVLSNNHLKKVPVIEDGRIVGVINRSDITKYSMESYLAR